MGQCVLPSETVERNAYTAAPARRDGRDFKKTVVKISRKTRAGGTTVAP
jgi:hypothetical protein